MASPSTLPGLTYHQRLGVGFYGEVHRGHDGAEAVRIVHVDRQLSDLNGFEAALGDAIDAVKRLEDPRVVIARRWGRTDDGTLVVVTDAVKGDVSVQDLLSRARGSIPTDIAAAIGQGVVEAIAYAHSINSVHGGIHPRSVLIDFHGSVRVADFALARALAAMAGRGPKIPADAAAYLAPELRAGSTAVSSAMDIYAAGVLMVELLTGQLPPAADLPPAILAVLRRATAPDDGGRFLNGTEFEEALEDAFTRDAQRIALESEIASFVTDSLSKGEDELDAATEDVLASIGLDAPLPEPPAPAGGSRPNHRTEVGAVPAPVSPARPRNRPMTDLLAGLESETSSQGIEELGDPAMAADIAAAPPRGEKLPPLPKPKTRPGFEYRSPSEAEAERVSTRTAALRRPAPAAAPVAPAPGSPPRQPIAAAPTRPSIVPAAVAAADAADQRAASPKVAVPVPAPAATPRPAPSAAPAAKPAATPTPSRRSNRPSDDDDDGFGDFASTGDHTQVEGLDNLPNVADDPDVISEIIAQGDARSQKLIASQDREDDTPLPEPRAHHDARSLSPGLPGSPASIDVFGARRATTGTRRAEESEAMAALAGLDGIDGADDIDVVAPPRRAPSPAPIAPAPAPALAPRPAAALPDISFELDDSPSIKKSNGLFWAAVSVFILASLFGILYTKTDLFNPGRAEVKEEIAERERKEKIAELEAAQVKPGEIVIETSVEEAAVWLLLGRTPADSFIVPADKLHELRIEHEGYITADVPVSAAHWSERDGNMRAEVRAKLVEGASEKPTPAFPAQPAEGLASGGEGNGLIHIESVPEGAQVWMFVGMSPSVRLAGIPAAQDYEIKVLKDGYLPGHTTVTKEQWYLAGPGSPLHPSLTRTVELQPIAPDPKNAPKKPPKKRR